MLKALETLAPMEIGLLITGGYADVGTERI